MAEEMTNIEIRDFLTVSGTAETDFVVLSLTGGTSAKIAVGTFQSSLIHKVTPSIKDGMWWIGDVNQEIAAEGQTPVFRKTDLGIEWKYTNQSDLAWTLLVPISDILFKFEELTEEQRNLISLKYSDLTAEEIKDLQQPANDMIAVLEATNTKVTTTETAREEAETKRAEAETARAEAETKRSTAETARDTAEKARVSAEDTRKANETERIASESARKTAETARASAEGVRKTGEDTRVAQESAREKAEKGRVSAETARVSAESDRVEEFARLKSESEAATADAQDTADHPTYVGEDNYVYKWNKTAQAYDKTAVYVRGESFSIKKVYASIDAMYADTTTSFKEGDFCLINTGNVEDAENAQLFVRTAIGGWDFLVDMSGAIGFTGKTPQLFIGTVAVGSGKDSADVVLSPAGTDEEGNPKYNLNYVIPCLAYEDLTAEQIAVLQRPANEMIAKLQATDDAVKAAEGLRVTAEDGRVSAESGRVSAEDGRVLAEEGRVNAEDARVASEEERKTNEAGRQETDETRKEDYAVIRQGAVDATDAANTAALKARNLPVIQNGTWWLYDVDTDVYVDSGYAVSSDYQLTREKIESVYTGNIETHWHDRYVDKAEGKQLSAEDFTTALKEKLEGLENYDDTAISRQIASKQDSISDLATIRSGAALGATALQEVPEEYVTETELSGKGYATASQLAEGLSGKVDTIEGKGLSTEDFTAALKQKLEGLENYDDAAITAVINDLRGDFDALVSGNTSSAIESFNEVTAFLKGLEDTQDLESIIASIERQIAAKQDSISDLADIRSGAALGSTALQEHQDLSAYAKKSEIPTKVSVLENDSGYVTSSVLDSRSYATTAQLAEGLASKQEKNLYFTNLVASVWVEDSTYPDYRYRCDLSCPGVLPEYYGEVVFAMEQFTNVKYSPLCETKEDVVSIWADLNDEITIPTVIIYK